VLNVLGWLVPVGLFVFLTPFLINRIGIEAFGLLALVQAVTGYAGILNFGVGDALVRMVSHHREEPERAMALRWAGMLIFASAGVVGAVLIAALSGALSRTLFQIPQALHFTAIQGFRLGAAMFLVQMLFEFFRGSALGHGRFDIPNVSRMIGSVASTGLIVWVVLRGGGVVTVLAGLLAGHLLSVTICATWMQLQLPLRRATASLRSALRQLLTFSKHVFAARIAGILVNRMGQIGVGALSGLVNVSYYDAPMRLAESGSAAVGRVSQVLYPQFARSGAAPTHQLQATVRTVLEITLYLGLPVVLAVVFEANALFELWISAEFAQKAAPVAAILCVSFFLSVLSQVPSFLILGLGHPSVVSRYSMYRLLIVAALLYPVVTNLEMVGAALLHLAGSLLLFPFLYEVFRIAFRVNFYRVMSRILLLHALLVTTTVIAYTAFRGSAIHHPAGAFVLVAVYWLVGARLGAFRPEARQAVGRLFRGQADSDSSPE
jgi:O-antigen/teichoic acid export membrane protein